MTARNPQLAARNMKLYDQTQNLSIRVSTIQIIAFVLLSILGARLYYLQVNRGEYYAERAENQRIRLIPIPAPRGAIFDRNGKILVDSRPTYNVTVSNDVKKLLSGDLDKTEIVERLDDYARGLNVDRQYVIERLNYIKSQREFDSLV